MSEDMDKIFDDYDRKATKIMLENALSNLRASKICFDHIDKKYLDTTLRNELRQGLKLLDDIKAKVEKLLE